jgi:hypothetical protein
MALRRTSDDVLGSRVPRIVLVGVIAAVLLGAAGRASRKLLWHDEILTLAILRQPLSELRPMLENGIDLTPPLFHIATEAGLYLPLPEPLGLRVTSIVAFIVCLLAVYAFVAHRSGRWPALIAVMVTATSGAQVFAYEARAYAMLLAFTALALLCWQRASDVISDRRRLAFCVALALCVAAAVSSHYYAVLLPLPLGLAEVARVWRRRRIDWGIVSALAVGLSPLLAYGSFIRAGTSQASVFFSKPNWRVTVEAYESVAAPLVVPAILAIAVVTVVFVATPFVRRGPSAAAEIPPIPLHEWVACLALILLPPVAFVLAAVTGTGYVARYVVTWAVGFAICLGLLAKYVPGGLAIAVVVALGGWLGLREAQATRHLVRPAVDLRQTFAALERAPTGEIAISHPHIFLLLQHYLPAQVRGRLVFVENPQSGSAGDTGTLAIRALRRWNALTVTDMDGLVRRGAFYLYTPPGWIVDVLTASHADMRLLGSDPADTPFAPSRPGALSLYHVQVRASSTVTSVPE